MQALETGDTKASSSPQRVTAHPMADSTQSRSEVASPNYPPGNLTQGNRIALSTEQEGHAIRQALQDSPWREVRGIVCRVNPTRVFLTGKVTCYFMKQMAQETVKHALGGRQIRNYVRVADAPKTNHEPW